MPADSVFVAALIGYRYGGLDDGCIAAGVVCVISAVRTVLDERYQFSHHSQLLEILRELRADFTIFTRRRGG
jgi:diadenosine tetraphosphatase ApaH/serine/threonine PP2A family protein phosphatase